MFALVVCVDARPPVAVSDAMRGPALKDVRLEGWLGAKMDRFIARRLVDPFMRNQVFDEARQAFEFRDDDEAKVGGLWRGEFWGKEMLSSARVADSPEVQAAFDVFPGARITDIR